jgi:hypothetical protein
MLSLFYGRPDPFGNDRRIFCQSNTVRSKPFGPVMTTRTPPRIGSAAIHPSYCSLPATSLDGRFNPLPACGRDSLAVENEKGHLDIVTT